MDIGKKSDFFRFRSVGKKETLHLNMMYDLGGGEMNEKEKQDKFSSFDKEDKQRYYEYLSQQIEREDGLVNNRLTWMVTTQGLLFAAIALVARNDTTNSNLIKVLTKWLPVTGMFLSAVCFFGVLGATKAIYDLMKEWKLLSYDGGPRPFGGTIAALLGLVLRFSLPILLFAVWYKIYSGLNK